MARTATKARKSATVEALEAAAPDRVPAGAGMWDPLPAAPAAEPTSYPNPNLQNLQTSADGAGVPAGERLERIPLEDLVESPLNPRKHFDQAALEQLMDSLLSGGQLTPCVARPRPAGGYELGAGHRRRRAALLAVERHPEGARYRGLGSLLVVVRELDDKAFIELLNVENLQRDDLHPLEEAEGFKTLMERCGYDVAKIAARIGKSTRYVYDSMTLLKLIPAAETLFLANVFERGHAIELARLAPPHQQRAIDSDRSGNGRIGGLFVPGLADTGGLALEDTGGRGRKPVTVRELKRWIDEEVRFKPAEADPVLFAETQQAIGRAIIEKEKVIEITYDHVIPDAARDPKAPRVYGAQAWRSATPEVPDPGWNGAKSGKPCEHAVTGVVVIGERRGQAFRVCTAKERCTTHWAAWQRERSHRPRSSTTAQARHAAKAAAEQKLWAKAGPALRRALREAVDRLPVKVGGPLVVLAFPRAAKGAKTLDQLVRAAAWGAVDRETNWEWGIRNHGPRIAKTLGVDVGAILKAAAGAGEKQAATKKATAKGKKKGAR